MAAFFLRTTRKVVIPALIILLALTPVWLYLGWRLKAKRKFVVAIIDKTVLTKRGQEHRSLNWILNHERFSKSKHQLYNHEKDYYGFFPLPNEKFKLQGLESFSEDKLTRLSKDADAAYITDTYGIYRNEWYKYHDDKARSPKIYGGLSEQDISFLLQMKARHKLIIAEWNCIGSPTSDTIRTIFENNFHVKWKYWSGRYFASLDTSNNKELPKWLVKNYMLQHNGQWPFKKSGIGFVRYQDDKIVVLENETHLQNPLPYLSFNKQAQSYYGLPEKLKYSYWFDIVAADTPVNRIIANFVLSPNKKGRKELYDNGIPEVFPAVAYHMNKDYQFFYFSADFCDNPVGLTTSFFKGISKIKWLFYNTQDPMERQSFFWTVYRPLVTRILNDYYNSIHPRPVKKTPVKQKNSFA